MEVPVMYEGPGDIYPPEGDVQNAEEQKEFVKIDPNNEGLLFTTVGMGSL